ncbi:perlucin-like [Mytilus trossulus]|uniref:perlucin-like n=1 Tax=Mytilus trossulus TaxID=6551 RepID=UPI003005EB79
MNIGVVILSISLSVNLVVCLCPEAFERHGTKCYQAIGLLASWAEAKRLCNILGADLAVIESATEEAIVEGILKRKHGSVSPENYWMDGSDFLVEGEWRWMGEDGNSRPITGYTAWSPGQPDNAGTNEHCLEIRYSFGVHWNDYECDHKQNFICQAPANPNGNEIIG